MLSELLNRRVIYPLYFRYKKDPRLAFLRHFEAAQWQSPDEIRQRQFERFRALVDYAMQTCPFYRELYGVCGLTPQDLKHPDDVARVPMISKKILQENWQAMASTVHPAGRKYQDASGGSTGAPTAFWIDKDHLPEKFGSFLMFDRFSGWDIGQKVCYLWGADRDHNLSRARKEALVQRLVYRNLKLNAFDLTEEKIVEFIGQIRRERPTLMVAYANAATVFARYLLDRGIADLKIPAIITSAETLSEQNRALIQQAFQGKVLNRYGSREVGLVAGECLCQEGLHVNAENVLVEVDEDRSGLEAAGEVIVTDFNNFAMPFIRYNMGDIGSVARNRCSCGRGLPLLKDVQGRTSDFIKRPDGSLVHGEYFTHIFYGIEGVQKFQVVQEALDLVTVNLVAEESVVESTRGKVLAAVREKLGEQVRVEVQRVEDIPLTASGKFRFTLSKL